MDITRRDALIMAGSAAAATMLPGRPANAASNATGTAAPVTSARPALTIFSRHLQWAGVEEAIEAAAAAGFGGIAWTVRDGAHIPPESVERDLRRAVELTHRAGLGTPHIVTAINGAETPYAESIVATAAGLGIHTYRIETSRFGRYDFKGDLPAQLEALRPRVAELVSLNEKYGAGAVIHTHIGLRAGGVWDTWLLVRDFNPERIGINFDTAFGTAAAGAGWLQALNFARRHIRFLSLKDFRWQKMTPEIVVPGQGVVDFQAVLGYFKDTDFHGPAEVQFEYPVPVPGSTTAMNMTNHNLGEWKLDIPKADVIGLMKRDVDFYAEWLRKTGLSPAIGLS
jgi:sugar phosphate isomerase/epimerase